MQPLIKRWLISIACVLHGALPKREIAVLHGRPDYEDNIVALEHGLRSTRLTKVVLILSSPATPSPGPLGPRTVVVGVRSIRGIFHFLTAKYVFFTHSTYTPRFPRDVVSVNVWHGMPVKRVGWIAGAGDRIPVVQYTLATSPLWTRVVQESLRPTVATLGTGLPRNDRLLLGDPGVAAALGYEPGTCRKLIVWLPTFRSSWDGPGGTLRRTHSLGVPANRLHELDDLLARHQAVCVVKPHPLAVREDSPDLGRMRFITDGWLNSNGVTLYQLLGASDALVTDVSSVYVDYLILDRPIVHHFPDIREYESSRGFSIGPIDDYLAGPNTSDPDEFLEAIAAILEGKDTHAAARRRVTALFHTHLDGAATARLITHLGLA
jgi:CDP-glycerol glycerophosphotransferase (TagB/SpsB family)